MLVGDGAGVVERGSSIRRLLQDLTYANRGARGRVGNTEWRRLRERI